MARFGGRRAADRARSAADREAARLERERRRAQREGRPLPAAPDPEPAGPAEYPVEPPAPEPERHPAPEAIQEPDHAPVAEPVEERQHDAHVAHDVQAHAPAGEHRSWGWDDDDGATGGVDPSTAAYPAAGPGDEEVVDRIDQPTIAFTPEEQHAATKPPPVAPPAPPAPPPATESLPGTSHIRRTVQLPRPSAEPAAAEGQHYEAPIGTRRAGRPANYAPQPGAGGPGHRRLTVPRRGRRRRLIVALVALLLIIGAVVVFAWMLFQPGQGSGSGSVRVVIPQGSTASQIGDRLAKAGVVDSGFFFNLRARLSGHRGDLRAGSFTLKKGMSYGAAISVLTTAPQSAPVLNATLPEGPSRRELAPIVRRAGIRGDYLKASTSSPKLKPRAYGAPRATKTLEGFLFPATYQLRRANATAKALVDSQLAAFKQNIAKVSFAKAKRKNLTVYDVLIIASMIEREVRVPSERPLVAAVIYNRLQQGIPLGIDATIRYYDHNWTAPLRLSELERVEPYNTRKLQGLTPTPIGNPGLAAIRAAANPAHVNYIYYVVKPCGNGAHNFSATKAQFDRDVAAYNAKRDQLGGKDPSVCKK